MRVLMSTRLVDLDRVVRASSVILRMQHTNKHHHLWLERCQININKKIKNKFKLIETNKPCGSALFIFGLGDGRCIGRCTGSFSGSCSGSFNNNTFYATRLPGCRGINPSLLGLCILPSRAYNDVATILKANLAYGEHYRVGTLWGFEFRVQLQRRVEFTSAMATYITK